MPFVRDPSLGAMGADAPYRSSQRVTFLYVKDSSLGRRFVDALAGRSEDAMRSILSPGIDFKGLTPGRFWEAQDAGIVMDDILAQWFEEQDVITDVLGVDEDAFADRARIGYRFHVENPDGPHVVEQQAYYQTDGERITWMRVVCSGFRPLV